MIKRFFLIVFSFLPVILFAQDDSQKNPSVELPSFVITGKDVISLPKLKKLPTGFISTVSEEYFKPAFTQDDFDITNIPDPGNKEVNSLDTVNHINGSLTGALGVNYRPYAKGNLAKQFEGGTFAIDLEGFNKRAFVENSDRYMFSGGVGFTFFIGNGSPLLANAKINARADYASDNYKLYAATNPGTKRKLENGQFNFGISNPGSQSVAYDFLFYNTLNRNSEDNYSERIVGIKGFLKMRVSDFSLNAKVDALNQKLSDKAPDSRNFNYVKFRPYAAINLTASFKIQAGFDFYKSDSNSTGNLFAAAQIPFGNGVSLYGEYAPTTTLNTYYELSKENRFIDYTAVAPIELKKKNLINLFFKYEYERYYEINGGFEYYSTDAHPYFTDIKNTGLFNIAYQKAASSKAFVNVLFHKGPMGYFYGDASYNEVKTDDGNQVPYAPKVKMNLVYGYDLENGIETEFKLKYTDFSYSDLLNKDKINYFIDLSLKGIYNFSESFYFFGEINNLLNNKNYNWKGYQEDTFNLNLGINYKF